MILCSSRSRSIAPSTPLNCEMSRVSAMIRCLLAGFALAGACLIAPVSVSAAISSQERAALLDLYNGTNGSSWGSSVTSENISTISRNGSTYIVTLVFSGQTSWAAGYSITVAGVEPTAGVDDFDGTYTITTISYDSGSGLTTLTYNQGSGNTGSGTVDTGTVTYGGGGSTGAAGWGGDAGTECSWYGVTCNSGQTSVTALKLKSNHLSGPVPSSLGDLTNLQELDLSGNQLTGPIPASLDNLPNLQYLDLSGNQLTGTIPSLLDIRGNLQVLSLSGNQLSGSIPSSLGNFTNLQELSLSANQLSGSIPSSLGDLVNLQRLYLSLNHLSGQIPPSLGSLTNLQELVLFGNQLSGPIPSELGGLANLQKLVLFDNQLSGPLPSSLGSLTGLQDLHLSGNQLSGSIPLSLGGLKSLLLLDLSDNQLSGPIPSSLSGLTDLLSLNLSSNQLGGGIPPEVRSLTRLNSLGIAYNALYAADDALSAFLDFRQPGWENTETVAPTGIAAKAQAGTALLVSWTPIPFTRFGGRYEVWTSSTQGGPYTLAGSTASKSASSLLLTGLTPGTYYLVVRTVTDPNSSNSNRVVSDFSPEISTFIGSEISANLSVAGGGATTASTLGTGATTQVGYATVAVDSGAAPYGTAVFGYSRNDIVVSEAGVPASSPTTAARIFVDYRTGAAIPGSAGKLDIFTGFAAANMGSGTATITYTLRDLGGQVVASGTGSLAKGAHISRYVNQLADILPGFSIPPSFPTSTYFGSLELSSSQPLSVVALRLTTNQRGDTLLTSTPVADLTAQLKSAPIYFPQLADGGGYATTVVLLNTSNAAQSGTLNTYAGDGSPLAVQTVNGPAGSAFAYSIPPGGTYVLRTDGSPAATNVGWVSLTPGSGTTTPVGAGIFEYSQNGVLTAESGIPSAALTTHARIFVDTSEGHDTGLALANPGSGSASIVLTAYQMDGSTRAGTGQGSVVLNANGHAAGFVDQQIAGLPAGFQGVLDIASSSPFAALTLRSLVNARGDFLLTTFPVADMNQPAPAPIVFPQIADGNGFTTEFILLSAGSAGAATISFFGDQGTPLSLAVNQ